MGERGCQVIVQGDHILLATCRSGEDSPRPLEGGRGASAPRRALTLAKSAGSRPSSSSEERLSLDSACETQGESFSPDATIWKRFGKLFKGVNPFEHKITKFLNLDGMFGLRRNLRIELGALIIDQD